MRPGGHVPRRSPALLAQLALGLALLLVRAPPARAFGGWLTNDGTASKSLVVADSGTVASGSPLVARLKSYLAVDGNTSSQWNAQLDATDKSCWLVLDFGAEATVHGFALIQRGDNTHDAKDHELYTGATADGPWQSVGSFVAQECKPPAFTVAQCRVKNQAGTAAFRQTFDLPSAATSRYFRWVAKTRYSEYQLYLYEIQFRCSNWGFELLLILGLGGFAYVGGGVALAAKTEGKVWRLSSHPHLPLWVEVHDLVVDGAGYTHGVAVGRRKTGSRRGGGGAARAERGYGSLEQREQRDGRKEKGDKGEGRDRGQTKSKSSKTGRAKSEDSGGGAGRGEVGGADPLLAAQPDEGDGGVGRGSAPAGPAAEAGVASAGSGRWVHIPS